MPEVSVVVASYNCARFLGAALRSVFAQRFDDFELIIVDDGSRDGSRALIAEWQRRHPEKIVVENHPGKENRGIVATYNLGVSRARGRYLAFVEPDDRWSGDFLSNKVRVFENEPAVGVVFSPYKVMQEGLYGLDMVVRQRVLRSEIGIERPFDNFVPLIRFNNVVTFSAFMCRKELWQTCPPPPDASTPFYDWWMLTHLSLRGLFYCDEASVVRWRCAPDTALGERSMARWKQELSAFFPVLFASVAAQRSAMHATRLQAFERYARALPHYLGFLKRPTPGRFLRFLGSEPDWATRSLVSYLVNWLKKS